MFTPEINDLNIFISLVQKIYVIFSPKKSNARCCIKLPYAQMNDDGCFLLDLRFAFVVFKCMKSIHSLLHFLRVHGILINQLIKGPYQSIDPVYILSWVRFVYWYKLEARPLLLQIYTLPYQLSG